MSSSQLPEVLSAPVDVEDEEEQQERNEAIVYETFNDQILSTDKEIPITSLLLDNLAQHGQIRMLSDVAVKARIDFLLLNPPTELLKVLVWPPSVGGVVPSHFHQYLMRTCAFVFVSVNCLRS